MSELEVTIQEKNGETATYHWQSLCAWCDTEKAVLFADETIVPKL